jgi:hypothetical protein
MFSPKEKDGAKRKAGIILIPRNFTFHIFFYALDKPFATFSFIHGKKYACYTVSFQNHVN